MKILVATKNPAKAREIKEVFGNRFECVSLTDFENVPEAQETGKTFEENAALKAEFYFKWSGIPSIADDGGLEIDVLGDEPGVKSRRWPGYEASDEELIRLALDKLKGVPPDKRTARLRVVVAYYNGVRAISDSQSIEGYIIDGEPPPCEPGYPFRAIFWIPRFNKLFQDLTEEEHQAVNHRHRALENVARKIKNES
ncbi:MAG: non-canonical purine NTP pyrophosphatase [Candidatus Brennerbacteria bacterium]|nr:non-canonical purine NTP pyrophosphatase [Candidatus Brennerbacteria bacterium]